MIEQTQTTRHVQRTTSVDRVVNALHDFFKELDPANSSTVYASTRDIANRSELSIYNTRHILMKLEKEGVITSIKRESRKSLYWNLKS